MRRRPLVISYPRSGVNWFSRAFEELTGFRSPGVLRGIAPADKPVGFHRTHDARAMPAHNHQPREGLDSAILLLRDPAWSFVRRKTCNYPFTAYTNNIRFFDAWPSEKLLVRFDDLFIPQKLYEIVEWMKLDYQPFADFAASRRKSRRVYHQVQHPNYVRRAPLPRDEAKAHKLCRQQLGQKLYDKYIQPFVSE